MGGLAAPDARTQVMDGPSSSSTARRVRARVTRVALTALVAAVALVATPGTASAIGEVTPVLECVRKNSNGTYTAVLGYTNSSTAPVTIPQGSRNTVSPTKYNGWQPTTFQPGTHRGAVTVTVTGSEYLTGATYWNLDGNVAYYGWTWTRNGPTCPPSTELPAEGNGTGAVIALGIAAVVGAANVHPARRRALAAPTATQGDEPGDA